MLLTSCPSQDSEIQVRIAGTAQSIRSQMTGYCWLVFICTLPLFRGTTRATFLLCLISWVQQVSWHMLFYSVLEALKSSTHITHVLKKFSKSSFVYDVLSVCNVMGSTTFPVFLAYLRFQSPSHFFSIFYFFKKSSNVIVCHEFCMNAFDHVFGKVLGKMQLTVKLEVSWAKWVPPKRYSGFLSPLVRWNGLLSVCEKTNTELRWMAVEMSPVSRMQVFQSGDDTWTDIFDERRWRSWSELWSTVRGDKRGRAHYALVSRKRIAMSKFWPSTHLNQQNDWTGWRGRSFFCYYLISVYISQGASDDWRRSKGSVWTLMHLFPLKMYKMGRMRKGLAEPITVDSNILIDGIIPDELAAVIDEFWHPPDLQFFFYRRQKWQFSQADKFPGSGVVFTSFTIFWGTSFSFFFSKIA